MAPPHGILTNKGEKFKKSYKNKGVQVHFKGTNTVKTYLWLPSTRNTNYRKMT